MKCPFKNCENKEDNTNFNDPWGHVIVTVSQNGHTHIHGPFSDEFLIRKMATAFMAEMEKNGIKYELPVKHTPGN